MSDLCLQCGESIANDDRGNDWPHQCYMRFNKRQEHDKLIKDHKEIKERAESYLGWYANIYPIIAGGLPTHDDAPEIIQGLLKIISNISKPLEIISNDYENYSPETPRYIVCAAIRKGGTELTICGARHYDMIMRSVIRELPEIHMSRDWAQGFVDQFGKFYTREAAAELVKRNGQPLRTPPQGDKLYSEDLY